MDTLGDEELIARFVATFCKLDGECWRNFRDPPPVELNAGDDPNDSRIVFWQPAPVLVEAEELKAFYYRLPIRAKLPTLYERLITSWRWLEVRLYGIRLFANPPGDGLTSLAHSILADQVFEQHLVGNGFVPFAFDTGDNGDLGTYNPVCFDTNRRQQDGDCPIVGFAHEAMLSFDRIGASWVRWASFRQLVNETIEYADTRPSSRPV